MGTIYMGRWYIMNWIFYYDEAFHDRKITVKNEKANIYNENASDIYSGVFNGYRLEDEKSIHDAHDKFEEKYKKIYTINQKDELKSTIIKKKNYQYGFASFNPNTVKFFNDFFDILCNGKVILHISLFSKTAFFINKFLNNIQIQLDPRTFSKEAFSYSIIKFLFTYRNDDIINNILQMETKEHAEGILKKLEIFMYEVIVNGLSSKKKKGEVNALLQIMMLLNHSKVKEEIEIKLDWDYMPIFKGYNKLLNERKINPKKVRLIIDEDQRTLDAAKKVGKYKSENGKSHEFIGLRISDILSHFLGEMSIALDNELREEKVLDINNLEDYDFETKKILSPKWFDIKEEQFLIWRKIEGMFYNYQLYEWTGNNNVFCDSPILIFALFEYIWQYETYSDFKEIPLEQHGEEFNLYCLKKLALIYERGGTTASLG